MNSRRNFLKIGSLAAAGSLVFGSKNIFSMTSSVENYFSIPPGINSNLPYALQSATFEPLINTLFQVNEESLSEKRSESVSNAYLRLVEVIKPRYDKTRLGSLREDGFSLIFQAEDVKTLEDKIYRVSHTQLSEFPLFISTVGRSGKRYQAVFSYLRT